MGFAAISGWVKPSRSVPDFAPEISFGKNSAAETWEKKSARNSAGKQRESSGKASCFWIPPGSDLSSEIFWLVTSRRFGIKRDGIVRFAGCLSVGNGDELAPESEHKSVFRDRVAIDPVFGTDFERGLGDNLRRVCALQDHGGAVLAEKPNAITGTQW